MPPSKAENGQAVDQARPNKTTRVWSGDCKAGNTATMDRWLDEKPGQEFWNAFARMNGPQAGDREPKPKI